MKPHTWFCGSLLSITTLGQRNDESNAEANAHLGPFRPVPVV